MSRLSQKNFQKIAEQVLGLLYERYPQGMSTSAIAGELGRDNEFCAKLMDFLHEKRYVALSRIAKSGKSYSEWKVWRLSSETHYKYSKISAAKG